MKAFSRSLLDLFFPPRCIYCDGLLKDSHAVSCLRCQKELPWIPPEDQGVEGSHFTHCISAAYYEGAIRSAFLQYKFYGQRQLAKAFAMPMQKAIEGQLPGRFDLITWIPVSEETLKKRGYDQARLLAEAIGQLLQTPVLAALAQPRAKVPQSTLLSPQARRENVKGCFALRNPAALKGKRVLLIDDVITTGATLEEACETLGHAGVQEVVCATFCRARKEDPLGEAPSS